MTEKQDDRDYIERGDQAGKRRAECIDIRKDFEVHTWARRFGVSDYRIKEAVRTAGPFAEDVAAALGKSL